MTSQLIKTFILAVFFLSTRAAAHHHAVPPPPDPMHTHWWWHGRYVPKDPSTIDVRPCAETPQIGFNVWTGLTVQTNMILPTSPVIGADVEFCVRRYSDVNWAPSRLALELVFGVNRFSKTESDYPWLFNRGVGIRYQTPVVETIDVGFDVKYNYLTNMMFAGEPEEVHHDLIASLLGEFRPTYSADNKNGWSGLFFTGRIGMGTSYYANTQEYNLISEILFNIGYRFAQF